MAGNPTHAELRARLHGALDSFLDALDAYRAAPFEDELVKLADVPIEARARTRLVRDGRLRVIKLGRRLYTRRSYIAKLVDELPPLATAPSPRKEEYDAVVEAVRRKALRRQGKGRKP